MTDKIIYDLVDKYRNALIQLSENFFGSTPAQAKKELEGIYTELFENHGVNGKIVSSIYDARKNSEAIQEIKQNIETYLVN